ncbi:MAG: porin, partial [Rickettsiaceae bacterium]
DLRTYNIGAILTVGNFSYGGSYGSLGKSLTTPEFHKTGRKTDYYTGTMAYKQGPFVASVSYFKSNQFKNTVDAVSIGIHYLLAPGFKPYAEISGFSLKGRPEFNPELSRKKTRGAVVLIGTKLTI